MGLAVHLGDDPKGYKKGNWGEKTIESKINKGGISKLISAVDNTLEIL